MLIVYFYINNPCCTYQYWNNFLKNIIFTMILFNYFLTLSNRMLICYYSSYSIIFYYLSYFIISFITQGLQVSNIIFFYFICYNCVNIRLQFLVCHVYNYNSMISFILYIDYMLYY